MEWLQKADKILSEDEPVHGDLDTVNGLIDQHRQFEEDLQVFCWKIWKMFSFFFIVKD